MAKRGRKRKRPDAPRKRQLSVMVFHRTKDAMDLVSSIEGHKRRAAVSGLGFGNGGVAPREGRCLG